MAEKGSKKWKRFEQLAAEIQREISPDAEVSTNQQIAGKRSGQSRQIDIVVKQKVGQFEILIIIDCKDYKHPLDVRDVESFIGMVEDIGAHKGALISVKGFTGAAVARAKDANVVFEAIPSKPFLIRPINWNEMPLFKEDGTLIDYIRNLVLDRWEDGAIPATIGTHEKVPLTAEDTCTEVDGKLYPVKVLVNAVVTEEMRFGNVPIVELRGFKDAVKDTVLTKGFTTDFLDKQTIHSWPVVASKKDLAVKPILILGMKSTLPRLLPMSTETHSESESSSASSDLPGSEFVEPSSPTDEEE
jgi:hypothetical protein